MKLLDTTEPVFHVGNDFFDAAESFPVLVDHHAADEQLEVDFVFCAVRHVNVPECGLPRAAGAIAPMHARATCVHRHRRSR